MTKEHRINMKNKQSGFWGWRGRLAVGLLVLGLASCRSQDIRTQTIRIPEVRTDVARAMVSNSLAQLEGVIGSSIRFENGAVIVTYDSMKLALKNMEFAIADIGFAANDTPANAAKQSALPASARP